MFSLIVQLTIVATTMAAIFQSPSETGVVIRAKRQCGGGGCCGGQQMCCQQPQCCGQPMCGQSCCPPPPPPPCSCGTPGCQQCVTNTVLVPVQQTTCCQCCQPVCTQACVNGGGCGCGCTRGGCGRKRRSFLAIANEQISQATVV